MAIDVSACIDYVFWCQFNKYFTSVTYGYSKVS